MDKTENFIQKAKAIYGDKYDYSKVEYKNTRTRVIIICPEHGEFLQMPETHLKGVGCPKCKVQSDKNLEEFIRKSREVHGDKYDYSRSIYLGANKKIEVVCPEHGSFFIRASAHYTQKQGCPKCGINATKEKNTKSLDEFISEANIIHNNYYDYSEVNYINLTSPVTIICPEHGRFRQAPRDHLQGCSCPKCSRIKIGIVADTKSFIKKAKTIHGDKYNYDKVNYVNSSCKVIITCPIHGDFEQTPTSHIHGQGCPKCANNITTEKQTYSLGNTLDKCSNTHKHKYDYIYSYSNYVDTNSLIKIICPIHGEFELPAIRHMHGQECPKCVKERMESTGELKTKEYLESLNVNYIYQAKLSFLSQQSYDFYLPDLNIAIEYNGKQHYEPIEVFGGESAFEKQVERDKRKERISKENNIKLLTIKYNNEENDFKTMEDEIRKVAQAKGIILEQNAKIYSKLS